MSTALVVAATIGGVLLAVSLAGWATGTTVVILSRRRAVVLGNGVGGKEYRVTVKLEEMP